MNRFLCFIAFLAFIPSLYATKILRDFDLTQTGWVMIGVPIHNYKMLPIQEEMATFLTEDIAFMQQLKKEWDFRMTFDDNCDYHYLLKLYQNNQHKGTLKINLHCGYITYDGLSYTFSPDEFSKLKTKSRPANWSRISFGNTRLLKKAIQTLSTNQKVYWYEDVNPYLYDGSFIIGLNRLPWNTDRDSLHQSVQSSIAAQMGTTAFYLQEHFYLVQGDHLFIRYFVNCDANIAQNRISNQFTNWRSHLSTKDSIRIVAIGVNKHGYQTIMKKGND